MPKGEVAQIVTFKHDSSNMGSEIFLRKIISTDSSIVFDILHY